MVVFILGGVFILGLCIFIHELGHYCFGYLVGVKAEIFSIGYGKGIWKKKIGDTTWQITAFPIGGYVKFYGDEEKKAGQEKVEGGFYSVGPLKRIIPVLGGPFFNLVLGFLVLVVLHSFSGPLAPKVKLAIEGSARRGGLQDGDIIHKVNKKEVHNFMELSQNIALSKGNILDFEIERDGKIYHKKIQPDILPSGVAIIGLLMPGEHYLQVNHSTLAVWRYRFQKLLGNDILSKGMKALPYLKDGDIILSIQGHKVRSPRDLQKILGKYPNQIVSVEVLRERLSWLSPWPKYKKIVNVPSYIEYILTFSQIRDLKYGKKIEDQKLFSAYAEHQRSLNFIKLNRKSPKSFENLASEYKKTKSIILTSVEMPERRFQANLSSERIGLMGFRPTTLVYGDYLDSHNSFGTTLKASLNDLANNIMVYGSFFKGLISGRLSFLDNAAGPVKIFGVAGAVLQSGFQNYLYLFAAISIALCIMNLLPFPVVDGGHIVLFLYEAIVGKPLSLRIRETLHRIGFIVLMSFGLWIMYRDFLWLVDM